MRFNDTFGCVSSLNRELQAAQRRPSMEIYVPPKAVTSIPIIDLGDDNGRDTSARERIAGQIHRACRETGFFYVANHGVERHLVDGQFAAAQRLFDLPLEEKMSLHMKKSPSAAGYEPTGGQVLDSQDANAEQAPPDLKESFYCGEELPDDHPYVVARRRGYGHNQWPSHLPEFRDQTLAYGGAVRRLGDRILALIARSLDLADDWFVPYFATAGGKVRLIKYQPHPDNAAFNQLGAGAHTDWGGITLLAQDNIGGLEVRNVSGDWIDAKPVPNTFVINLGDLMARWTNGLYNSNMHRVKNNSSARDRYSIAFFYSPDPDAVIDPIPTCVDEAHPRRFATCTAEEHTAEMFRRSYGYLPGAA
jgi:isopenicillin N synthase-like dioxygenase